MLRVDLPELQAEGIVLCSFRADTVDYQPVPRRFLCFRWEKLVPREAEEAYFCVFIPWKHREKQLVTCRQGECTNLRGERPAEWIRAGEFASRTDEGTVLVRGFDGYPCLREHEAFLCNELLSNHEANLETLYAAMPELLRESIDEEQ